MRIDIFSFESMKSILVSLLVIVPSSMATLSLCDGPNLVTCQDFPSYQVFNRGCMKVPEWLHDKVSSYAVHDGCCNFYKDIECRGTYVN